MTDDRPTRDHEDPDDKVLTSVLGPQLVARLFGLLRATRTYDQTNQTVRDQLREAVTLIEDVMDDQVTLVAMGQCFYLNGARVRVEASKIPLFNALSEEFEQRRLGGVRFLEGVRIDELGTFIRLMVDHADAESGARLGETVAGAGVVHIVPITLDELETAQDAHVESGEDAGLDERSQARRSYRQALQGTKAAILRTARTGRPAIRRAKRVVQPIVDSAMKNDFSIVGMTAIKNHDEYTYAHSVNVSILSIAIGQTLGLPRGALANLGVGALLHDVGKTTIPVEVLAKPGRLSEEDWALMRRHPLEGAKVVTHMPGLSSQMLDVLGVCMYHHARRDGSGYPKIARTEPPPMARIAAIADCYDAMTTHRAYRSRPFTGYEALGTLLGEERGRFDSAVLWALVQTVGLYPAGTLMQTETGYLVLSLNNDRNDLRRPHCRVLAYPDGTHALDGQPVIWEPMPRHETVARVVSPEEFEVEIDRLLAA
ncbi:MAG: HD domain-containing protein [Candidatus Eisenbacteria bacterium]|nr:HD domain-containing protein [Candidatus Eisenbacteria bacterium]